MTINLLAIYYMATGNLTEARRLAEEALALQKQVGYRVLIRAWHALTEDAVYGPQYIYADVSNAYYVFRDLAEKASRYDQALDHYMQLIKGLEDAGLHEELAFPYFWIGKNYLGLNEVDKSIEYFRQSLAISHRKGEAAAVYAIFRLFAEALVKQGNAEQALRFMQAVHEQNLPMPLASKIGVLLTLGHCHSALKQYPRAEPFYREAVIRSEKISEPYRQLLINISAARFYVQTGEYGKAGTLLNKVHTVMKDSRGEGQLVYYVMEAHMLMFKVDSAVGNYPSAIRHYQQYTALKDSTFNETKSKQMEEMSIRYETEKKDQDLKLKEQSIQVLSKEKVLQQEQIKQATFLRNGIIGGAAMLLLLLGVIYNRYRLKQRSNRLLQAQQSKLQAQQQQIQDKNQALEQLLVEKERLLKEIHHRVKNNLQIVMSLLNSQAASLQDKAALSAIQESQHRVQAMALIHQKLYQAEGVARIPMKAYIEEVVAYLQDTYTLSRQVGFRLFIEPIELDVSLAVPLGLIINEAITNAFKYAFPAERSGVVYISLLKQSDTLNELTIADDGVGLPIGYDPSQSRSLGMTLIHGFSAQLGGELTIEGSGGVKISLLFADEKLSPINNKADHNKVEYVY
jgi:two-component sensor histidine kinase